MKQPITVTVDPHYPIAYVQYIDARSDRTLLLCRDPDGVIRACAQDDKPDLDSGALIDVTPDDEILGFEILSVEDLESVVLARDYARDNGLAFPADLRAAARDFAL